MHILVSAERKQAMGLSLQGETQCSTQVWCRT